MLLGLMFFKQTGAYALVFRRPMWRIHGEMSSLPSTPLRRWMITSTWWTARNGNSLWLTYAMPLHPWEITGWRRLDSRLRMRQDSLPSSRWRKYLPNRQIWMSHCRRRLSLRWAAISKPAMMWSGTRLWTLATPFVHECFVNLKGRRSQSLTWRRSSPLWLLHTQKPKSLWPWVMGWNWNLTGMWSTTCLGWSNTTWQWECWCTHGPGQDLTRPRTTMVLTGLWPPSANVWATQMRPFVSVPSMGHLRFHGCTATTLWREARFHHWCVVATRRDLHWWRRCAKVTSSGGRLWHPLDLHLRNVNDLSLHLKWWPLLPNERGWWRVMPSRPYQWSRGVRRSVSRLTTAVVAPATATRSTVATLSFRVESRAYPRSILAWSTHVSDSQPPRAVMPMGGVPTGARQVVLDSAASGSTVEAALTAARPVCWRGRGDLQQATWAQPPKGTFLLVELWAGVSGLALAMLATGMNFYGAAAELDATARACAAESMPNLYHYTRVEDVAASHLRGLLARRRPRAVILGGGSPCQGNSALNKNRRGLLDARSLQPSELRRLIHEFRQLPEMDGVDLILFLENVASMPKEVLQTYSQWLQASPVMIDAATMGWVARKRLYWMASLMRCISADTVLPSGWECVSTSTGYPEFRFTALMWLRLKARALCTPSLGSFDTLLIECPKQHLLQQRGLKLIREDSHQQHMKNDPYYGGEIVGGCHLLQSVQR